MTANQHEGAMLELWLPLFLHRHLDDRPPGDPPALRIPQKGVPITIELWGGGRGEDRSGHVHERAEGGRSFVLGWGVRGMYRSCQGDWKVIPAASWLKSASLSV